MKRSILAAVVIVCALSAKASAGAAPFTGERLFSGTVFAGYAGGMSLYMGGTFANFAEDFPFRARIGLGYVRLDPGEAVQAHEVFIAEDPDGTPKDRGTMWDARLDLMYPINFFNLERTFIFGGPRYCDFDGYFEYIGGAETFDVSTTQWGLGGGLETSFPISPRVDLLVSAGADYYFRTTMDGHDTYYRPNGDDTHPIENYTYKDADAAINQPEMEIRTMLGLSYHF